MTELELTSTLWRAVGQKRISNELATKIFRDFNRHLVDGFLQQCGLDAVAHCRKAIKLSRRYAFQHLTMALDVLHVAAACLLETPSFASFDTLNAAPKDRGRCLHLQCILYTNKPF